MYKNSAVVFLLIASLILNLTVTGFAQDYFPTQIGNRIGNRWIMDSVRNLTECGTKSLVAQSGRLCVSSCQFVE